MLKYKLTDQYNTTYGNTKWGISVTHETSGDGELCGFGWLHYYHSPELAVLLNPMHACIVNPKLWEVEATGIHKNDNGLKSGCTKITTIREIPLPEFSIEQKIKFGILCALQVYKDEKFMTWSVNWLNGTDRSGAAARGASGAAYTATHGTACSAAYAAYYAACAADAYAAAAYAVNDYAAYAAAYAAVYAKFDLQSIALEAQKSMLIINHVGVPIVNSGI